MSPVVGEAPSLKRTVNSGVVNPSEAYPAAWDTGADPRAPDDTKSDSSSEVSSKGAQDLPRVADTACPDASSLVYVDVGKVDKCQSLFVGDVDVGSPKPTDDVRNVF